MSNLQLSLKKALHQMLLKPIECTFKLLISCSSSNNISFPIFLDSNTFSLPFKSTYSLTTKCFLFPSNQLILIQLNVFYFSFSSTCVKPLHKTLSIHAFSSNSEKFTSICCSTIKLHDLQSMDSLLIS